MTIAEAPFVGIAVPVEFSPISKAYWQTNASVKEIALRFSLSSEKKVTKRSGPAKLLGVACRDCCKEIVVKNRAHAISELKSNRVQCRPCFMSERQRRLNGTFKAVVRPKAIAKPKPVKQPTAVLKEDFYKSWEWRTLRMEVLKKQGRSCQCCGAVPGQKYASGEAVRLCVDHIKPLSKYWELRLEPSNLQILCDECNMGKGNWDETDFRAPAAPDEWVIEDDGVSPFILDQLTDKTTGTLQ